MTKFEKLEQKIRWRIIKFRIRYKKGFFKKFVITLFNSVYFESEEYTKKDIAFIVLAHEYIHLLDNKSDKLFYLKYIFPQVLGIFSFFALFAISFSNLFLLFLLFLLAVFPWSSPPRTKIEQRGYAMTIAVTIWEHGYLPPLERHRIRRMFTGPSYWYMCKNTKKIDDWITQVAADTYSGRILNESVAFRDVHKIIKEHE